MTNQAQAIEILSKKFNRKAGVWEFKFHIEVAAHEVYTEGYLANNHSHFRFGNIDPASPSDLAICMTEIALREKYYIEMFENFTETE